MYRQKGDYSKHNDNLSRDAYKFFSMFPAQKLAFSVQTFFHINNVVPLYWLSHAA